ncbi:MAG TPA: hypothetical protein VLA75_04905 [Thermoanaerobaculia bacterium]|nr:hypothetical protein [Thermoanaerobaculia bacterium]
MRRPIQNPLCLALLVALAVASLPAAAAEPRTDVPALAAFHEVIYPLWHDAWPKKDLAVVEGLLPQLREHVAALQEAELPQILHEKQAKWDAGVAAVAAAAAAVEQGITAKDGAAVFAAVESLHSDYEGLVRLLRPAMAELDAYHRALYQLYHHDWPGDDPAAVAAGAKLLGERCAALAAAKVPARHAARAESLSEAFAALCAATSELEAAVAGGVEKAALDAAVEAVHGRYEAASSLFD